jgi:hypothetical protein
VGNCDQDDILIGMEVMVIEYLKIILPNISAIFAAAVAYYFGRRKSYDDIRIKRGVELAEEISVGFQNVVELYEYFYEFYNKNYGHVSSVQYAAENFSRQSSLFKNEYELIETLNEKSSKLTEIIKKSRIYLNNRIIDDMLLYLSYGKFTWHSDSVGLINTYYETFFENIINPDLNAKRKRVREAVIADLPKLL